MRWAFVALVGGSCVLGSCTARLGVVGGVEAGIVAPEEDDEGRDRVWVCHQGRWQGVGAPAADTHSRHGDRVSTAPQEARASC